MKQTLVRIGGIAFAAVAALVGVPANAQTGSTSDPSWTTTWASFGEATSLALDPRDGSRLFAGTRAGLAASTDGGQSWNLVAGSPQAFRVLVFDPSSAARVFGGSDDGVFLSTDAGAHFSLLAPQPTAAIAVDPVDDQTVYAAGAAATVSKSTDGGSHWTATDLSFSLTKAIGALIVDPENHDNVFAGVGDWNYSYYYFGNVAEVVGSRDAGQTWRLFLDGASGPRPVKALAFDPRTSQTLYAGNGAYVYRTLDGGVTWTPGTFALGTQVSSLAVDSVNPDTVYAGTDQGVFRSVDRGTHWAPLPELPNMDVRAIALDASRQVLHAATGAGVYETGLAAEAPSFPCTPAADALCLLGSRFRVRTRAWDWRTGRFATGRAVPQTEGFGYFSLPDLTGDASLPEVLLKMVDAEALPPWKSDWVFFGGLTDLLYVVTVTDTATGVIRSYQNQPTPGCGGADTEAFPPAPASGPARTTRGEPLQSAGPALELLAGRFELTVAATDPHTGRTITGSAIPREDAFGYFSLPDITHDATLPEVFVKMLDGRSLNHSFWLFVSTLTNVPFTLTIRDTTTGFTRSYPSTGAFCGGADTSIPGEP